MSLATSKRKECVDISNIDGNNCSERFQLTICFILLCESYEIFRNKHSFLSKVSIGKNRRFKSNDAVFRTLVIGYFLNVQPFK